MLQSRGFDVLSGAELAADSIEPVLVVMPGCLSHPQTRHRFERIRACWPSARVFNVLEPFGIGASAFPVVA